MLFIHGGRYHHNWAGGCTAVNSSVMHLNGVLVDYNGAKNEPGIEKNGINYATTATGSITDTTAANNTGSGFYCSSTPGAVTFSNFVSGIAQGNTLADVTC